MRQPGKGTAKRRMRPENDDSSIQPSASSPQSEAGRGGVSASNWDAEHVLQRIAGGDSAAESALVERFQRGTRLMLRRLVGDPTVVDDLVQETLTLVIDKARAGEIREPDRLAGFVRSVARNLLIADRRKEARYATVEDAGVMETLLQQDRPAAGSTTPNEPSQLDRMLRDEEARIVRQLLGELRHNRDRELLLRYYLSDEDKHRLCHDLEIEPGHFRRVLFRARKRLQELWTSREKGAWIGLQKTG